MSEEVVSIELFRVAINLPPRGNEEGGYWAYDDAQTAWETQTAAQKQEQPSA